MPTLRQTMTLTTSDVLNEYIVQPPSRDGYAHEIERVVAICHAEAGADYANVHFGFSANTEVLTTRGDDLSLQGDELLEGSYITAVILDTNNPSDLIYLPDDPVFDTAMKIWIATRDGTAWTGVQARVMLMMELSERRITPAVQSILYNRLR